ncbi:MAG: polysaccharide deacetylase family protein [Rhodothermia bacterium]|nr:polysaccharide deacetylase family protein [Rhodothermia bacterium]
MPLDEIFLQYPKRGHRMDHDWYAWSNLFERPPLTLPNNARVAVMLTIPLTFFPLNPSGKPFKAPGSMVTPYPDFRHYTTRDYGNRVGVFRLMKVLDKYGFKANFAMNSVLAEKYPILLDEVVKAGHEIVAHGVDMDALHYGGMDLEVEKQYITESLEILRSRSGQAVNGWLSPAFSESFETPHLVAAAGCTFICDWANDDLPYWMKTQGGKLVALPLSQEISDHRILIDYHQTEESFVTQVLDQFDALYEEAGTHGARVFSLLLTPYISGLPFRVHAVETILKHISSKNGYINLTGTGIGRLLP